jgi:hypothetical protein
MKVLLDTNAEASTSTSPAVPSGNASSATTVLPTALPFKTRISFMVRISHPSGQPPG